MMGRISELSQVVKDVEGLRKKIEKEIGPIDLPGILKRIKNPSRIGEIIQTLTTLTDKITLALSPLSQLRNLSIDERVKIQEEIKMKKSPLLK